MFEVSFRYKGEPDENLYGLKAAITKREKAFLNDINVSTRKAVEDVLRYVAAHWSRKSPGKPNRPPAIKTGNLASSHVVLARDLTGRFASKDNAELYTIIWDTRKGDAPEGRDEYAAVQEYGLGKLKAAHPFLGPAMDAVHKQKAWGRKRGRR